jgi:hypothetical protein
LLKRNIKNYRFGSNLRVTGQILLFFFFFEANSISISVRAISLAISIGKHECLLPYRPYQWYRVEIRTDNGFRTPTIFVSIGDQPDFQRTTTTIDKHPFTFASFSNLTSGLLFLGTSIRFSDSPDPQTLNLTSWDGLT